MVLHSASEIYAMYGPVLPAQDGGRTLSQMRYTVEECKGSFLEQGCVVGGSGIMAQGPGLWHESNKHVFRSGPR